MRFFVRLGLASATRNVNLAMTVAILAIAITQFAHQQTAEGASTRTDQGATSATGNAADDGACASAYCKIFFSGGAARNCHQRHQPKCYFPHFSLLHEPDNAIRTIRIEIGCLKLKENLQGKQSLAAIAQNDRNRQNGETDGDETLNNENRIHHDVILRRWPRFKTKPPRIVCHWQRFQQSLKRCQLFRWLQSPFQDRR
jgi:hypothetical protein